MANSNSSDSSEDDFFLDAHVRIALFDESCSRVLMFDSNKLQEKLTKHRSSTKPECPWDLPYFVYNASLNYSVDECVADLQSALGLPEKPSCSFNAVIELLGAHGSHATDDTGNSGYLQLLIIESRIQPTALNSIVCAIGAWKDMLFVTELLEHIALDPDKRIVFKEIERMLKSTGAGLMVMKEPRHHFGWYSSAVDWIDCIASSAGFGKNIQLSQKVVSPTSTVIEAMYESGHMYLKSPAPISHEAHIMKAVHDIFPEASPVVLGHNVELNAFITKGCEAPRPSRHEAGKLLQQMGCMQLRSLSEDCMTALCSSDVKVCSPHNVAGALNGWVEDDDVKNTMKGWLAELVQIMPKLIHLFNDLSEVGLPLCLVHGDLMPHNARTKAGGGEDNFIILDWEYAHVGHPFSEVHEIYELLKPEDLTLYLQLWFHYGNEETLRRAIDIGRVVGWCVKICKCFERLKMSDRESNPQTALFASDCIDTVSQILSELEHVESRPGKFFPQFPKDG